MQEPNLSKSQELKKDFFQNEETFFTKKSKFISYTAKDTTKILSTIASHPRFSQIRQRYKVMTFLGKILLKSHMNFVLYAFTKNEILYIGTSNHIGQSELSLQKINILTYCAKSNNFNMINKINIFRDSKYKRETLKKEKIKDIFSEKSHGIFINNISDIKMNNIVEKIRGDIKNNIKNGLY
jgi:hypothetical protein